MQKIEAVNTDSNNKAKQDTAQLSASSLDLENNTNNIDACWENDDYKFPWEDEADPQPEQDYHNVNPDGSDGVFLSENPNRFLHDKDPSPRARDESEDEGGVFDYLDLDQLW